MTTVRVAHSRAIGLTLATTFALLAATATALDIAPPDESVWLLDYAELVSEADATRIADICAALNDDASQPIYVLTIPSMATYDPGSATIERFAQRLYEEWAEHPGFPSAATWRNGILLLISKGDRKARIELGADWRGHLETKCQRIMDHAIIPAFKRGDFSGGILAGVTALDQMARDDAAPDATPVATPPPATAGTRPPRTDTAQKNVVAIPAQNRPVSRQQHYPQSNNRVLYQPSRPTGFGNGPGGLFMLFFLLVPVIGVLGMLFGNNTGANSRGRHPNRFQDDDDCWSHHHGSGSSGFDHHSHGISSHHDHGGSSFGSSGAGHHHAGGGGGASGSW